MSDTTGGRSPTEVPWPFGAEKAHHELNLDLIESHAADIVGRAMATRRLVLFAGAGLTMAYGRMTWSQLLDRIYLKLFPLDKPIDDTAARKLWPQRLDDFRSKKGDYAIAAQLFHDIWLRRLEKERAEGETMQQWVADRLRDHHGRLEQLQHPGCTDTAVGVVENRPVYPGIPDTAIGGPENRPNAAPQVDDSQSRASIAHFIKGLADKTLIQQQLAEKYQKTFLPLCSREESPLDILINDFGIRRFLTTNYDEEIERALEAFDYPKREHRTTQSPASHGTWHRSRDLTEESTGEAICFAIDGARRHAEVLHLHGRCDKKDGLIITEADYQRLYLEEHDTRDLLENAVHANFGANPILFVGSNVEEDDIMRPMRQFMTGARHRRDRMAVALLPALRGDVHAYQQKLHLYLRFGVHAIHYGYDGAENSGAPRVNILEKVDKICSTFQLLCEQLDRKRKPQPLDENWPAQVTCEVTENLTVVDLRDRRSLRIWRKDGDGELVLEKQDAHNLAKWDRWNLQSYGPTVFPHAPRFREKYQKLVECLQHVLGCLLDAARSESSTQTITLALEEIRSAFTTLFMCAALTQLHFSADRRYEIERKLPRYWNRPEQDLAEQERLVNPVVRHAVLPYRPGYKSWFADADTSDRNRFTLREPPEALQGLVRQIERNHGFRKRIDERRAIVISAPRGAGKGALFDSLRDTTRLQQLCTALRAPDADPNQKAPLIFHINLSFSDEIGAALSHVARTVLRTFAPTVANLRGEFNADQRDEEKPEEDQPDARDEMEMLSLAMDALKLSDGRRCLLLLGNATVLFDERGEPKNGQVRRFVQLLTSSAFERSRLDIVLFCSEAYVPAAFRAASEPASRIFGHRNRYSLDPALLSTGQSQQDVRFLSGIRITERRQQLLNLRPLHKRFQPTTLLLGLQPIGAADLCRAFFAKDGKEPPTAEHLHELDLATGRNRMAMTMILVLLCISVEQVPHVAIHDGLPGIVRELSARPPGAAMERVTALVFDRWFQLHLRGARIQWHGRPDEFPLSKKHDASQSIELSTLHWNLVTEVMWTLSVVSQPVDVRVLLRSESVRKALGAWLQSHETKPDKSAVIPTEELRRALSGTLELLVHWCLVFRVKHRPGTCGQLYRYSLHRQIQRHFLQLSGGHRIETTRWDQFATTLYASQPDELPTISRSTHQKLVKLVESLSNYAQACPPISNQEEEKDERRECLRASYGLIRASFSMGVLARSAQIASKADGCGCGAMEQYRRLVRWILLEARVLDGDEHGKGVFYPGELIWLYNECGVISLAQGKLDEAEELLTLAERAAKNVENDGTGSLHVRVRLHTALTAIERGRLSQGRAILLPISRRRGGHPVPCNLAKFYLGLIEHLGGNYTAAEALYLEASTGLREVGRPRALAFVLQAKADLHYVLHPKEMQKALTIADEAISLAQRGGHEDVRIIASLAKVRLQIEAGTTRGIFEQLDFAERYATRMDMPRIACEVRELRARLLYQQGETVMSAREASASLEIAALYDLKLMKIRALLTLAKIYVARGEREGAAALVASGKEMARSADYFSCVRQFDKLQLKLAEPSDA